MMKIKPNALLVCGIIAAEGKASIYYLKSRTHLKKTELYTLLEDMQTVGMIRKSSDSGLEKYSLLSFQTEISS